MKTELIFYSVLSIVCVAFLVYRKATGKKKNCPECGATLPKYRVPANLTEVFWGGWTCTNCGCAIQVDFFGNITSHKKPK